MYWGQQRSRISFLGQAAIRRRQGCGHCPDAALVRLETPVGSGNQRTALHDWCYLELAELLTLLFQPQG